MSSGIAARTWSMRSRISSRSRRILSVSGMTVAFAMSVSSRSTRCRISMGRSLVYGRVNTHARVLPKASELLPEGQVHVLRDHPFHGPAHPPHLFDAARAEIQVSMTAHKENCFDILRHARVGQRHLQLIFKIR